MASVLVTGGAGFIGSHLCERLADQHEEVIVLDDFSSGSLANIADLERRGRARVRVIQDSITNIRAHGESLATIKVVYHLAALISGYYSLQDPEAYLATNIVGLIRLIDCIKHVPRVRVVFASSSALYGNNPTRLCSESTAVAPTTIYALSKCAGEQTLEIYSQKYGFDYVSLRFFSVYGPRQSPNHPYANVAGKFLHAAATGAPVRLYGDGEQSRDFVYVDDVVDALLLLSSSSQHKIYNIGTGIDTTINGLMDQIECITGQALKVERCGPWPNDIRAICADTSRLQREFGFSAGTTLANGLAHSFQYIRNRLVG